MTDATLAQATRQRCENAIINRAVAVVEEYERLLRLGEGGRVPVDLAMLVTKLAESVDAHARANAECERVYEVERDGFERPMGVR